MNVFGGGLGNTIPILFVSNSETDIETIKSQITFYLFSIFAFNLIISVLVFLFFQEKPPKGFGFVDEIEETKRNPENFVTESIKHLSVALSFPLFITLSIVYVVTNSTIVTIGATVNVLVQKFGFESVF